MPLTVQIRSERGKTWSVINVVNNGRKERKDFSGRRSRMREE